jgi:hypothetical protein
MTDAHDRTRRAFRFDEAKALLARTPAALDALLGGLPEGWIHAHEGGETWSPFDVLGHLVEGERSDWIPRARRLLDHGESKPFDKFDRFAQFRQGEDQTIESRLEEFAEARRESLRQLDALELTDADLNRTGRHPELGIVTLRNLLATWVAHDMDHITQIARVIARQYTGEVGPWTRYLRVISGSQG